MNISNSVHKIISNIFILKILLTCEMDLIAKSDFKTLFFNLDHYLNCNVHNLILNKLIYLIVIAGCQFGCTEVCSHALTHLIRNEALV